MNVGALGVPEKPVLMLSVNSPSSFPPSCCYTWCTLTLTRPEQALLPGCHFFPLRAGLAARGRALRPRGEPGTEGPWARRHCSLLEQQMPDKESQRWGLYSPLYTPKNISPSLLASPVLIPLAMLKSTHGAFTCSQAKICYPPCPGWQSSSMDPIPRQRKGGSSPGCSAHALFMV